MHIARFLIPAAVGLALCADLSAVALGGDQAYPTLESLGAALFDDVNLSANRSQACSTCHSPDFAFTDPRPTKAGRSVSLGDDGHSMGDRNAPSAAYALFSPHFHKLPDGTWIGGQFWDGRATGLAEQAAGPPLNPIEMGMKDHAAVAGRIGENPDYVEAFKRHFGAKVLDDPDSAYKAMTEAIASFEKTTQFAPFDSRYDRYLKGEEKFTDQEELGRTLFFSSQFASCSQCHDVTGRDGAREHATFSSYKYFNIGVPENLLARKVNGMGAGLSDFGLIQNPAVGNDPATRGLFKVPSLRNVAVTGPYMHNGVFKDLRTVVSFYNKYNSKKKSAQIDPETGKPWASPETSDNLALKELQTGAALDDRRIDALVAFLKTLTDKRYEGLAAE